LPSQQQSREAALEAEPQLQLNNSRLSMDVVICLATSKAYNYLLGLPVCPDVWQAENTEGWTSTRRGNLGPTSCWTETPWICRLSSPEKNTHKYDSL